MSVPGGASGTAREAGRYHLNRRLRARHDISDQPSGWAVCSRGAPKAFLCGTSYIRGNAPQSIMNDATSMTSANNNVKRTCRSPKRATAHQKLKILDAPINAFGVLLPSVRTMHGGSADYMIRR